MKGFKKATEGKSFFKIFKLSLSFFHNFDSNCRGMIESSARKSIIELRRGNKKGNTYIQVSEQKLYIVAIEKNKKNLHK